MFAMSSCRPNRGQIAVMPPSTGRSTPAMKLASSDARNKAGRPQGADSNRSRALSAQINGARNVAISVIALREISRMPTATAEYCNQREKRKMFRPSISFVAVVAAAALPAGFAVPFEAGSRDDAGRFMGGTEMRVLAGHAGKLYAGNGYWEETRGPEGRQGPRSPAADRPGRRRQIDDHLLE